MSIRYSVNDNFMAESDILSVSDEPLWYKDAVIYEIHVRDIIKPAGLLPQDRTRLKILLDAFLFDKAIYEVGYELNNRPDWVKVPL